jgi:phosphotransferase system  glucose/maltose/N-acetylglucosamine-specific IIC component
MDGSQVGLVGGIAGGVVGVMGGVIGTYFSIKNTKGTKERGFVIRAAVVCWLGVTAFLVCLFLITRPWNILAWVIYIPLLFWFIRWANAGQARARVKDMPEADL